MPVAKKIRRGFSRVVGCFRKRRNPESISTKSTYLATDEVLYSAITGLNFITEDEALKKSNKGEQVTQLSIRDVFYTKFDASCGAGVYYIPDSEKCDDPEYDYDFTNYQGDDTNCTRGGYPYRRPAGWNRKAVRVIGKYEDEVWLGEKGWRDYSSPGEWIVSYHGTEKNNIPSIITDGYDNKKSVRQKHGKGIYSAPDFKVAESYAKEFTYGGDNFKCILQNRVNPTKMTEVPTKSGLYYITDEDDIRPYGICFKKI